MSFDPDTIPAQSGRIAVVTGANSGIGFHTARDLAAAGAHVVFACRDEQRATAAMRDVESRVEGAVLEFIELDLAALDSVREFATTFRSRHDTLDLLINNAGVMWVPFETTEDGFELHMAANHFGHFLLTSLLIDLMPDDSASRVVALSSLAHAGGAKRIRFDDLNWQRAGAAGYKKHDAYAQTKLACLMFAFELNRRLSDAGSNVLSIAAHPGVSPTELVRQLPAWQQFLFRHTVAPFVTHEPRPASLPTLMAAVDPSMAGGEYIGPTGWREMTGEPGFAKIHECALDPSAWTRLWDRSIELTGATFPFEELRGRRAD